jgi:hypothetical protein
MFLRKNCSGAVAVGLELDIVLTGPEKQPPQDLFLDGYVHTGGSPGVTWLVCVEYLMLGLAC